MSILGRYYLGVARLKMSANQNIASATETEINFDSIASPGYDPFLMVDTVAHSITVREAGLYFISTSIQWGPEATPVAQNYRYTRIHVNGANADIHVPAYTAPNDLAGSDTAVQGDLMLDLSAGDEIVVRAAQGSGETLTVSASYSHFTVFRLPVNFS